MKVLHVIARMNVGGTATYLINLLKGLEQLEVNYMLAFGDVTPNETEDSRVADLKGVRIRSLSRNISPIQDLYAQRALKKLIGEYNPDVIHSHTFKAGALVRTLKSDKLLIHTYHGHHLYDPDYGFFKKKLLNTIERKLAERNKAIVSIGENVAKELLAVKIGSKDRMISIAPGISKPVLRNRQEMCEKHGLDSSKIHVLWMGRLTNVKRPDRALGIARRFPEITFLICGGGELRQELEAQAPRNVKFMGVQSAEEMLSIADLALLTSDSEGMPLTLIEAQMSGIPAVATNVGSVSEIIMNGKTGFVTRLSEDEISERLALLVENTELRRGMSMEASKISIPRFSISRMVNDHMNLYQKVMG